MRCANILAKLWILFAFIIPSYAKSVSSIVPKIPDFLNSVNVLIHALPSISIKGRGMASTVKTLVKLQSSSIGLKGAARGLSTSSQRPLARVRSNSHNLLSSTYASSFRRSYAELKPTAPSTPIAKVRRFRTLRYLWRITYLSALGGIVYLGYGVWDLRNPEDQFEQDPNKQNLVILGTHDHFEDAECNADGTRYGMGRRLASQEA